METELPKVMLRAGMGVGSFQAQQTWREARGEEDRDRPLYRAIGRLPHHFSSSYRDLWRPTSHITHQLYGRRKGQASLKILLQRGETKPKRKKDGGGKREVGNGRYAKVH